MIRPSQCIISTGVLCLIPGDVILDNLVKILSLISIFLCCQVTAFPFVINQYLEGDTLGLCKYSFFPRPWPTDFGSGPLDLVCSDYY